MGSTNGVLLPIPELTESADGPKAVSDLSNAIEDYFFDRIISAAQATAGVARYLAYHWGAGTTLPSGGLLRIGDTYQHNGLRCLVRWNGTIWRQIEPAVVATAAERDTISTTYAALLHMGFKVTVTGTGDFEWGGTTWFQPGVWVEQANSTYSYTIATSGSPVSLPSMTPTYPNAAEFTVVVPLGRTLNFDFLIPYLTVATSTNSQIRFVDLTDGGVFGGLIYSTSSTTSIAMPAKITGSRPGTGASKTIRLQAWASSGTTTLSASTAIAEPIRLRYCIV